MCPVVAQLPGGAGGPGGRRDGGGGGPDGGVWAARPGHAPPAGQAGCRLSHRRQDPPHLQPAHQPQGRGNKLLGLKIYKENGLIIRFLIYKFKKLTPAL